jgi:diacylglycerol kinase
MVETEFLNVPVMLISLLVIVGVVLSVGSWVLDSIGNNFSGEAKNVTDMGNEGIYTFASFQSIFAIILVSVVILGIIGLVILGGKR